MHSSFKISGCCELMWWWDIYKDNNKSSTTRSLTVSPQWHWTDALENAIQDVSSPQCLFPISCSLIVRNTNTTQVGYVMSGTSHQYTSTRASAERTEWEHCGNSLGCSLWGHFHSDAYVCFTGSFSQHQGEAVSEGPLPKSVTTPKEEIQDCFFLS